MFMYIYIYIYIYIFYFSLYAFEILIKFQLNSPYQDKLQILYALELLSIINMFLL